MRWPLHYWRKDYHQFNVAKILLSHTHEGIASSRANDDPPLFSLDNGKLSPSRNWTLNLPLCNPKLLSTEWAKNVAKILLSQAHEGIVSCNDPPLFSLDNGQLVHQGTEPLTPHSAIQTFCQLNEQTSSLSSIIMYFIRLSHLP